MEGALGKSSPTAEVADARDVDSSTNVTPQTPPVDAGASPGELTSPSPSSPGVDTSSSECGDLNLVPPPRPPRFSFSARKAVGIAVAACFLFIITTTPLTAVLVSNKGHEHKPGPLFLCNDSVCHVEAHYYDDKLDSSVDPCDDYYSYVCSSSWYRVGKDLRTVPYLSQSSGYLYQGLQQFAGAYLKEDMDHIQQNRHHFGHQIVLFIASCVKESGRNPRETDSLESALKYFDLEKWPYDVPPRGRRNVAHIAGKIAGSLAVFPLLETRLQLPSSLLDQPAILLGQAKLTLSPHELMDESRAMDWYRDLVSRAVRLFYGGGQYVSIVDGIILVERRLAHAVERLPKQQPFYKVRLGNLPAHRGWDWMTYLNAVLKGTSAVSSSVVVSVRSVAFLQRLVRLTQEAPVEALLNYLGYRVLVALSPLLPADFLVPLAVEGQRIPGFERLQCCVQLMEKVFGNALTVVLQHASTFLNQPDTKQKLSGLLSSASGTLVHFLNQSHWMDHEDIRRTALKVANVSVSLCIPDEKVSEHDLGQYFIDVPMLNERSLVESYFHMKTSVERKYWSVLHKNRSLFPHEGISSFDPDYMYESRSNALFLPYGVVGFLLRAKDVLPMHVPRFLPYAIRGLFAAIMDLRTVHDQPGQPSWSRQTALRFSHIAWCFLRQYNEVLSDEAENLVTLDEFLDEILQDNAVLEPLYRIYVNSFPLRRGKPAAFRLPTLKSLSTDELFFINFAIGHCEDVRNDTMVRQIIFKERIPAKFKVNLPLRNFQRFATVYKCKKGSRMNPSKTCTLWGA